MTEAQLNIFKERYEGKIYPTKDGMDRFEIVSFNNSKDVDVRFIRTNTTAKIELPDIKKGVINPLAVALPAPQDPIEFTDPYKKWVGCVMRSNQGDPFRIIDYQGYKYTTVQFLDQFGYTVTTTIQNVKNGEVLNPYHVNQFGGYLGDGPFTKMGGRERDLLYTRWHSMLIRANDSEYYKVHHGYYTEAYDNTTIIPEWLCFNNFAIWMTEQLSHLNPAYDYEVDKDLKYNYYKEETGGMKCYGPNYCVLIPHEFNNNIKVLFGNDISSEALDYVTRETNRYYAANAISNETYQIIQDIIKEWS